MFSVALFFTLIRLGTRLYARVKPQADDFLATVACVVLCCTTVLYTIMTPIYPEVEWFQSLQSDAQANQNEKAILRPKVEGMLVYTFVRSTSNSK
jgi:hypothetical protein